MTDVPLFFRLLPCFWFPPSHNVRQIREVRKGLRLVDGEERRKRELAIQEELQERKEKEVRPHSPRSLARIRIRCMWLCAKRSPFATFRSRSDCSAKRQNSRG